jgi:hypothetical protein
MGLRSVEAVGLTTFTMRTRVTNVTVTFCVT